MAKDAFETNKRDLHDDMEGVRTALGVVRGHCEGVGTAHDPAGESERIRCLPECTESDSSKHLADFTATAESAAVTRATAGESEGITESSRLSESDSSPLNSSGLGSLSSARARRVARFAASASARVCLGSSSLAVPAAVPHAHTSILHDACSNSWSDTVWVQGPTSTRRVRGGVSGPAEDLRPVSEVETG